MNQQKTGKYIAEKRKQQNMTQAQLAEKLGVSDRAVSKWERVTVFHDEIDSLNSWEDSLFYKYEYYYKVYVLTDEKHNSFQYVITVYGDDYDEVRKTGESVIASMEYNDDLEVEFVRKYED